ncbi:MAG: diaminobutyrate acetyltransferase [Alphaproteobacteria bacterium]
MIHDEGGTDKREPTYRRPTVADGPAVWRLVKQVGTLDLNSSYVYLLLCRDFAETCVIAELEGKVCAFLTGYKPPDEVDTLFVWQVGVGQLARGLGVASGLLKHLLLREGSRGIRYLETTVASSNTASRALFRSLARRLETEISESQGFPAELLPEDGHEPEPRLRIGPIEPSSLA